MKIYIAGKISGLPIAEYTNNFAKAKQAVIEQGHEPISHTDLITNPDTDWKTAMRICIAKLVECDAVLFLENYKESKGALLEFEIARKLEMKRYFDFHKITLIL